MRLTGEGAGVSAEGAVQAVNDWNEYQLQTKAASVAAVGAAYQIYDTLNFTATGGPAATYGLNLDIASTATNAGSEIDVAFRVDGGAWIPGALGDFGITNGRKTNALVGFPIGGLAVGGHTFEVGFGQPASPGITSMTQSVIFVQRLT